MPFVVLVLGGLFDDRGEVQRVGRSETAVGQLLTGSGSEGGGSTISVQDQYNEPRESEGNEVTREIRISNSVVFGCVGQYVMIMAALATHLPCIPRCVEPQICPTSNKRRYDHEQKTNPDL